MLRAKVYVTLKDGVLDPQGETVRHALESLGFQGVQDIRMGKYLEVSLNHGSKKQAHKDVTEMCKQLLANTVIEDYQFDIEERDT